VPELASPQRKLNPAQLLAVEHDIGPMLVLAGAGSGKTRVVTLRIARLLERGVLARSILAMTFTNKAAAEMRERVERLVGRERAHDLVVSTFHSFGMRVLSAEARRLGLRHGEFAVFDQGDAVGTIREILREVRGAKRYDIGAILTRISHAKNQLLDENDLAEREGDEYDEITKIVFPKYRAALRAFCAFDFDDLVCEPVRLFARQPDVLEKWQERFRYVLVDEYQDTNRAQLELVRLLAREHRNITVVGDDDQSIYAWRGADVSNILDFERHFPGAKVVKLEQNYRSTGAVLSIANSVLAGTRARRHEKVLVPTREAGSTAMLLTAQDPDIEAGFVAEEIERLGREGVSLGEIAILYRSNLQGEPLESALRERRIPFRLVGGTQFYERKEVKDVLAYLRVVLNPTDEIALRRVINYPARQIGEAAIDKLTNFANTHKKSLMQAVELAATIPSMPDPAIASCRFFAGVVDHARRALEGGARGAGVARELVEQIKLRDDVWAGSGSGEHAERRWGNVESLLRVFERHDARPQGSTQASIGDLVRFLTLNPDRDDEPAERSVTLSTMHGVKGLEYEVVFVVGLEEGLLPHARSLEGRATDPGGKLASDIEEERRLFYVSITRAKNRLYLSRTRTRSLRGKMVPRVPSRFLSDIPDDLVQKKEMLVAAAPSLSDTAVRGAALLAALGRSGSRSS
jgi:DNA helicase-2/ATP-dependent DNA helicase PcrA